MLNPSSGLHLYLTLPLIYRCCVGEMAAIRLLYLDPLAFALIDDVLTYFRTMHVSTSWRLRLKIPPNFWY